MFLKMTKPVQQQAQIKERTWRVEVMSAQPTTLAPSMTLYGRLETPNQFKAASPAASRVARVLVRDGDRVAKGALLAELDEKDFLPRLQQFQAEVAELEALLESENVRHRADLSAIKEENKLLALTREGVERANRMLRQQLGSNAALDEAEQTLARQALSVNSRRQSINEHPSRVKALEARLARARAQLSAAQLDFERSRVVAPFDGVVSQVAVAAGDQIKDGALLLTLYNPEDLEVRARIPAPFLSELQQALDSGMAIRGAAQLGGSRVELELARLAGEADASGVEGLFHLQMAKDWLRVGQVLQFSVTRLPNENAIAVPYSAVYGGGYLYTLVDGRMHRLDAQSLGAYVDEDGHEQLLIHAPDLQAGDQLILTHLPNAMEGLRAEAAPGR